MTFLPFETVTIETRLPKGDVINALLDNIEPEKTFRFIWSNAETTEFEGHLRGNEFEIKRIISYRNSFKPIIKGRLETHGSGTRITIDMRMHMLVNVFMGIWMALGVFGLMATIEDYNQNLMALGMAAFGYLMCMGGYLYEASKAKRILSEIVEGQVIDID